MDPIVNNQVPPVVPQAPQASNPNPGSQVPPKGFMATLEYYLVTKAPFQIPANIKEIIVKYGPWVSVIFLLTFIPLILLLIGIGTAVSVYSPYYATHSWSIYSIISLVTFVMGIIALPGLFKRKISGWNMSFYQSVVSFVGSIIAGNIIGGIISIIVGLYVLFQIRSYYK